MSFLHGVRDSIVNDKTTKKPERMDVREKTSSKTGRHQWNKGPRLKEATMCEEGEDIWQDLEEDRRARSQEANSQNFHYTM
jgi:hypothetical protein